MTSPGRRLCILAPAFFTERVGGVEVQTYLIAKHLRQRGWDVHFIAQTKHRSKVGECVLHDGIQVHWLGQRDLFAFFRRDLVRTLRAVGPDVLYLRGRSRLTSSPLPRWFASSGRCVLIYHCAENTDLVANFYAGQAREHRTRFVKRSLLRVHALLSDRFYRQTLRRSDVIVAQSQEQQRMFRERLGRDCVVIPSGQEVPGGPFDKTVPPLVLWIANASRRKRPEMFVDLAWALRDTTARFVLAGNLAREEYGPRFLERVGTVPNLEYAGPVAWEVSNDMFARASVFVNTSLPDREGFPNTYLQAWLRETPVVTVSCDPDDVIADNGLGYRAGTFDRMVADVRGLVENEPRRREMGRRARKYAVAHHDIREIIPQLEALLESATSREPQDWRRGGADDPPQARSAMPRQSSGS